MAKTRNPKKGVIFGLLSGLTWGFYTIFLYNILDLFNTSRGDTESTFGIMLIIATAVVIALIDSVQAWVIELFYLAKKGMLKTYFKTLFSKDSLGILPAALFSGLIGAVPFAIASSYSSSVAGSVSAANPAIGAIVAAIWFKEKLSGLKFGGILLVIFGTGILYGFSGAGVPSWVYLIAILCAVGYAFESLFGYNMLRGDIDSTVTTVLRRFYLIGVLSIILVVLLTATGQWSYPIELVKGFVVNGATYEPLALFSGSKAFVWVFFLLGSAFSAASYIFWYYSMEFGGVATAQVLNITYGLWIVVLLALPPFLQSPTVGMIVGAVVVFSGAAIVVRETARLESEAAQKRASGTQ